MIFTYFRRAQTLWNIGRGGEISTFAKNQHDPFVQQFQPQIGTILHQCSIPDREKYTSKTNWHIQDHYTFGGYAKYTLELIQFINAFYQQYQIPLDPIYTGKMLFGIFDLIKTNQWVWEKKYS